MAGTGVFTYRSGIAVLQVLAFSLSLAFGTYIRYYSHRLGSFCIIIFSLIRLIGASCMLATIHHNSHGLWATILVCESLGILLLLFLLLELLERVNKTTTLTPRWVFRVPQYLTYIDIAISIAGYVAVSHKSHHQLAPTPYTQAGMAIVALIFIYIVAVLIFFWLGVQNTQSYNTERKLVRGVGMCVPLMVVRLVYSLVFVATGDMRFNAVKGASTAYLFMTALPEIGVVGLCVWTVLRMPRIVNDDMKQERGGGEDNEV